MKTETGNKRWQAPVINEDSEKDKKSIWEIVI